MYNIKKNMDRLNRSEPTFFLESNEVKEISKHFKKMNSISLNHLKKLKR